MTKRIMVDMSATLIHHGHIRILQRAAEYGEVIVALTTDDEIKSAKGYEPELPYEARAEILMAIRYVSEVVPTRWLVTQEMLDKHRIDLLVHGDDNRNQINERQLLIFPRTEGVSSTELRLRAMRSLASIEQAALADEP